MNRRNLFFLFFLVIFAATVALAAAEGFVGDKVCLECHDDVMENYEKNVHYRIQDFELKGLKKGCESCHGPGAAHAEEGDAAKIFTFKSASAEAASAACLKCHRTMRASDWHLSDHAPDEVACSKCHPIHKGKSVIKSDPYLCMACHKDVRVQAMYPSHHPLREGKMKCSSCHQHHGSLVNNLKTNERLNDLCFSCHADKRGPFVFEHAPVTEDCLSCHNPHGTVANNLLKQNEPFLCLQCHESHFHAGRLGLTDARTLPSTQWTSQNPHGTEGWRRAFLTKCTQCHFKIHGTDNPSQTTSGRGKGMIR
ncbi:MAG: DmsE family decaheme c-type cytochrome [Candidatus Aminicenantes bacterium]|nr:DmsE family decaheme c-type cytochrome [Candidatus Aminicenantes bacterium]